ncbi:Arc family DNA-binding protein [Agrobacterium larrymoorei]
MPTRKGDQFVIRMPDGLRNRIKVHAKINLRTMNAEIVYQLSRAYSETAAEKADAPRAS